jgi:arylsulfatase A-like enzyme
MDQPNVVLIIADQHRWDFVGEGGNGRTYTPALDQLGRAGARFRSAYCTSPLCCPSRAAIASGRYGMNSGCFTNLHQLPPGTPSFISQFRDSGYRTCAIGKTHMEIHAYDSDLTGESHRAYMDSLGWDEICEISGNGMLKTGIRCAYSAFLRGRGHFDEVLAFYQNWHYFMDASRTGDHDFVPHEWPFAPALQETAFVGQRAVDWLRRWDGDRPFLLHVGFAAPHSPIEPLPAFMDFYRDQPERPPWGMEKAPGWMLDGRRGYRAMISQVDHYVGQIVACLDERGWRDNTILVYTADHGEMAGDHGCFGKTCFCEPSVRVPLLVAGPGIQAHQERSALVELLDLGKTLCDLCAVEPHALDQGHSLAPLLQGRAHGDRAAQGRRETVYAEMGCDKMICNGRYKLMWGDPASDTRKLGRLHLDKPVNIPPSPCRLYDLEADPHELNDLSQDRAHRDLLMDMMGKLLIRLNQNSQTQPLQDRGQYHPIMR